MPQFKDEHIIIIAPGSQTTLAQLGLPESFTPARFRFKSRMFPAEKEGEWEPHKIRKRNDKNETSKLNGHTNGDTSDATYEEDLLSDEGAVWPIQRGSITDWPCFFGLMQHIYQTVNPPFHTPILLVAEPAWTTKDHERITQFFFEKFRTPGFAIMDAAQATCYAFGVPTACVVDVGKDKANVTAITEHIVHDVGRAIAVPGCGGESMTQRLLELLPKLDREKCEQLKASPICEILSPGTPSPGTKPSQDVSASSNPAAAASTGAAESGPNGRHSAGAMGQVPRGPGQDTEVGADENKKDEEQDESLDIASLVVSGKMNEVLAKREKEKAERLANSKKRGQDLAAAAKLVRQKNSDKIENSFFFEDHALLDALKGSAMDSNGITDASTSLDEGAYKTNGTLLADADQPTSPTLPTEGTAHAPRREITVGTERFLAASGGILTDLSTTIHRVILSVPEPAMRPDLWNNMIIVGNGSAVRGFREALLTTLQSRFIISPSSATIFTSELPSNMSTPLATGANTPIPQGPSHGQLGSSTSIHHGAGVNPLLIAATTASAQSASGHLAPPSAMIANHANTGGAHAYAHSSHAQTPTSIKLAKIPEYFPEWKEVGSLEAMFLGAQVAAKMLFVVDAGGSGKAYMSRSDYNEEGPRGIHDYSL